MLTWNIYHGRSLPPAGRPLLAAFARRLAGWEWDVALLQEVPPWWPEPLALACAAEPRTTLTSRNLLLPLRRAIADRAPDLIKSNGGGANAILVRGEAVLEHRSHGLCRWPERRRVHAVRLASGVWVGNLHASTGRRARRDVAEARAVALGWADGAPLVLGGDLNNTRVGLPGLEKAAGDGIDQVWARGLEAAVPGEKLDSRPLSDHAPVRATLALSDPAAGRSREA